MLVTVTFAYVAVGEGSSAGREISKEEGDKPLIPSSTKSWFGRL